MLSEDVLAERRQCITGTDVAAIVGFSKWGSPLSVYCDKLGLTERTPDNKYMEWGRRLEPLIADKYAEDNSVELIQGSFTRAGIYGGTPDYRTKDRLIEIKTTGYRGATDWGEPGTDQIPPYYLTQVQWYLNLLDLEVADVAVLIGGNDYRTYLVKRNQRLINVLLDQARFFWEKHIQTKTPPPPGSPVDNGILARLHTAHSDLIVDRPFLDDKAARLAELKEQIAKIDAEGDVLQALIKGEIGDHAGIRGNGWSATWKKTADTKKVDWKAISYELNAPKELIDKHTKIESGYRRFYFKSTF